jgi:hypothetical protein
MIDIMERYLSKDGHRACFTDRPEQKRGEIVKSFAEDPDCRVFIGSLKAGGVGIDLISASVVIHTMTGGGTLQRRIRQQIDVSTRNKARSAVCRSSSLSPKAHLRKRSLR